MVTGSPTASEELEIKLLGGLYAVTEENLKRLLAHLEISVTVIEGKTKRQVLKGHLRSKKN